MADDLPVWDGVLELVQGDEWVVGFYVEDPATGLPMSLEGLEARMQCRPAARSSTLRFGFESTGDEPRMFVEPLSDDYPDMDEAVPPGQKLVGWVVVHVGADETAGYPLGGKFDVEVYDPADPAVSFKPVTVSDLRIVNEVTR